MKKLITYSLWGTNPTYNVGAIRNAEMSKDFYPDWICRFYVGTNTPQSVIEDLRSYSNTEVIETGEEGTPKSMLWRFQSIDEPDVEVMMPRDTDCRPSHREVDAVKDWLSTDKKFHIMRDHPYHATAIMGGMWGMRKIEGWSITDRINEYLSLKDTKDEKGMDQVFLARYVYPLAQKDSVVHDPFFSSSPFGVDRDPSAMVYFVGECVTSDDGLWSQHDRDILDRAEGRSNGN